MSKIGLIIGREFNERVRKRSFLVTTLLTPLLVVGLMAGAVWLMSRTSSDTKNIEVIDHSGIVAGQLESDELIRYTPARGTLEQINADHPDTWGVLVVGADVMTNSAAVQLYTYSTSTLDTEMDISRAISKIVEAEKLKRYNIENLPQILDEVRTDITVKAYKVDDSGEEKESSSALSMGLSYALGGIMYMFVVLYGAQVMQGVIEEKNSKVLEVVVSSVRPFQLMMGKIIGIACVAITQFAIWVVVIAVGGAAAMHWLVSPDLLAAAQGMSGDMAGGMVGGMTPEMMQGMASGVDPKMATMLGTLLDFGYIGKMLGAFLIYFIGCYLLYAAMYAAVGSAVDNVQDAQQFQMPITLPILAGLLGMIQAMRDPMSPLAFWLSIIPFTSPLVMVARIPYGVPAWELVLSLGLLAATFVVTVWLAGKIYRVGIFMYGKKPTFRELARWITYKS